jgi:hypothetical protein
VLNSAIAQPAGTLPYLPCPHELLDPRPGHQPREGVLAWLLLSHSRMLEAELCQECELVEKQRYQIERHQKVLDVQFRRMADIQAELDLVKATVRLAAPTFATVLIGRQTTRAAMS